MAYKRAIIALLSVVPALLSSAQQPDESPNDTIASVADGINGRSGSTIIISQPDALNDRVLNREAALASEEQNQDKTDDEAPKTVKSSSSQRKVSGYRVQVFSDSKAQSARNAAYSKKRQIEAAFAGHRCYVIYNAPYWRVKVGDFRSRSDAEALAADIRHRFPALARDIRVVRDRVNAK